MRAYMVATLVALCLLVSIGAAAQAPMADLQDIGQVLRTLKVPASATENPVLHKTDAGFLSFLGAPPGGVFLPPAPASKTTDPAVTAQSFIEEHRRAFGLLNTRVTTSLMNKKTVQGQNYVHLKQTYANVPVFAGEIVVQVDGDGNVRNVMSKVISDTRALDDPQFALAPGLAADAAEIKAKAALVKALTEEDQIQGVTADALNRDGNAELVIFNPSLLKLEGPVHLAWVFTFRAVTPKPIMQKILVDAHSGEKVFRYSLIENIKAREIFDANGNFTLPAEPVRIEGGNATGIADVDATYDILGVTYDFYSTLFARDSYDDNGALLVAYVRIPEVNAFWYPYLASFLIGTGLAVDDVVAHEYTHAVTDSIINLIYQGESGALSEHFSDTFGEFVDLTDGIGNDTPAVRWLMGEDIPQSLLDLMNPKPGMLGIRNMKNPPEFGDPDRYNSPLFVNPDSSFDLGGVHRNDGVGNKLVYLLTDGDTFNNQTVAGFGIVRVATLVYTALPLLTSSATYFDYYLALGAASVTLSYTFEDRLNIVRGGRAVEIEPTDLFEEGLRGFRAISDTDLDGNPVGVLYWTNPPDDQFGQVTLVRSVTSYAGSPNEGTKLFQGNADRYLDRDVVPGVRYYYTLFVDMLNGLPQIAYGSLVAGVETPKTLTEAFASSPEQSNIDLAYTQIMFTPVGPPSPLEQQAGTGYAGYEATVKSNVFSLPVAKLDERGRALYFNLSDDTGISFGTGNTFIPFFGRKYESFFLSPNGYISFLPVSPYELNNFPSLATHFAIPRISFLFADLAPNMGGQVWSRDLSDRVVITFENVPEYVYHTDSTSFDALLPNTVQVELFYSGHIRVTYQELNAKQAVVGLSDGQGVPRDPADLFEDVHSVDPFVDFSQWLQSPTQLSIDPVPVQVVQSGELITFVAHTNKPASEAGVPILTATWIGPIDVPFADNGNGTGTFHWQTTLEDAGVYTVRVLARLGDEDAYQDVRLIVGDSIIRPEARDLLLHTSNPLEDPSQSRTVSDDQPLTAEYEYFHPLMMFDPELYGEGPTILYWYRNGELVPSMTGVRTVPPAATRPTDRWYFGVLPFTKEGVGGNLVTSPVVTIYGGPEVLSVTPNFGQIYGGETVHILGSNITGALSVKFGGVPVASIKAISLTELEVVAPLHTAATVDVTVTTSKGTGRLSNAFTYQAPVPPVPPGKIFQILGCGPAQSHGGRLGDVIVMAALGAGLLFWPRRRPSAR